METWVAFLLTALTAFMVGVVAAGVIGAVVARSWLGLRPPKPAKVVVSGSTPSIEVPKPDTATKPQKQVAA